MAGTGAPVPLSAVRVARLEAAAVARCTMIWLFERHAQRAKLEVLYLEGNNYEVRFIDHNGNERVEHFRSAEDAGNRQPDVEHALAMQGWSKTGEWKL